MSEIQEPKINKQGFDEIEALDKIREYQVRVVEINKSLCNIHYGLKQYGNNSGTRQEPWTRLLKSDFKYLELSENQFYINSIGDFFQLYRHLKSRYEAEVLTENEIINKENHGDKT